MLANVLYRGLAVAMGTRICSDDEGVGPFVELDPPMPVGTALAIELVRDSGVESRQVKVKRVHEGAPAGMFIAFTDGASVPKDLPTKQEAALSLTVEARASEPATVAAPQVTAAAPAKQADLFSSKPSASPVPASVARPESAPDAPHPEETRRTRRTMQVSITTAEIIRDTELEAVEVATKQMAAVAEPASAGRNTEEMDAVEPRDTQEMPAMVTMDAEPEDDTETPAKTTAAADKPDENKRGGKRNRKRSKTVIGH